MSSAERYSYIQDALPGIVLGLVTRYREIHRCLMSDCDLWVLKVEAVLIHCAFILGYASPARLVWLVLRQFLQSISQQAAGYLDANPHLERDARMFVALVEYVGLAQIWNYVRDASLCMRFNNCDSDYFGQLSNMKIAWCKVDDPRNDLRKLTTCEKIFNDVPLILLAVTMLLLAMMADAQLEGPPQAPGAGGAPTGPSSNSTNANKAPGPGRKAQPPTTTPQAPAPSTSGSGTTPKLISDSGPSLEDEIGVILSATILDDLKCGPHDDKDEPNPGPTSPSPKPGSSSSAPKPGPSKPSKPQKFKPSKDQVIHGKCPECDKVFYKTVPRPLEICCSKSSQLSKGDGGGGKGSGKGGGTTKKDFSADEYISERVVREMFKEVKCPCCRKKLQRKLMEAIKKERKRKELEKSKPKADKNEKNDGDPKCPPKKPNGDDAERKEDNSQKDKNENDKTVKDKKADSDQKDKKENDKNGNSGEDKQNKKGSFPCLIL